MRFGSGLSRRSILLGISVFFFSLIVIIKALPSEPKTGEVNEPSVTFPSEENNATPLSSQASSSPTTYLEPTGILQTQVPPISMNSVCANIWDIELPATLPGWLETPPNTDGLYTNIKYVYLAGHMISEGIVNARDCSNGGLTQDGVANTCGMEKAYPEVIIWQNQFNQSIFSAAQENQIPAVMIKRLFAQETQFWPPNSNAPRAYGIGNVSSPGIEPLFMWNYEIYQDTCNDVYSQSCSQPYTKLPLQDQQILRGYFIKNYIDSYCDTCKNKIDLEKTKKSIDYFAKLIVANCFQVNQILYNYGFSSQTLSYEDAWRLTLANYTVGPSCINHGIEQMDISSGFSWVDFNNKLGSNCDAGIYIDAITR